MKNKLEPLSDYVIELEKEFILNQGHVGYGEISVSNKAIQYTHFLLQLLSERYEVNGVNAHHLNRFVPCDLEGDILVEPLNKCRTSSTTPKPTKEYHKYLKAKERVIFVGFEYQSNEGKEDELVNEDAQVSICLDEITEGNEVVKFKIQDMCSWGLTLTATGFRLSGKK